MTRDEARVILASGLPDTDSRVWAAYKVWKGKTHPKDPQYKPTAEDAVKAFRSERYDVEAEMAAYPKCQFQPFGFRGYLNPQFPTFETSERLAELVEMNVSERIGQSPDTPPEYWFTLADDLIRAIGPWATVYNDFRRRYRRQMEAWNRQVGALNRAFVPVDPDTMFRVTFSTQEGAEE